VLTEIDGHVLYPEKGQGLIDGPGQIVDPRGGGGAHLEGPAGQGVTLHQTGDNQSIVLARVLYSRFLCFRVLSITCMAIREL